MRKSILLLINGFGIEKKGSLEIYNSNLMPNMDSLIKTSLFGSLITEAGDYNNGYRIFGKKADKKNKEDKIDGMIFDKTLSKNEVLINIANSVTNNNKLHVFFSLNKNAKLNQVREYLKIINPNRDKNVFIHIILMSENADDYDAIMKQISKISFDLGGYAKVGFIVGKNHFNSDDTLRTMYKEFGEHWNEVEKKIEILKKDVINPENANIFYVNKGFQISENDTFFFINYEDVILDKVLNEFNKMNISKYSLYEINSDISNMFIRDKEGSSSFVDLIEKYNIKILTLTDQVKVNDINYYLNGMNKKLSPNLSFGIMDLGLFATKELVINLVETNPFDGIILDFNIGNYNNAQEIRTTLNTIDRIIKSISDATKEKGYTFMISSLYGMHSQVTDGNVPKVIDFAGKVPCIFTDNEYVKGEYSINSGNIEGLRDTFLTTICDDVKSNKLVHKLSALEKLLSKK